MSLPIPNLDDKTFEQLFEEARLLIPRFAREWTDHNFSDPGITMIDLFAWLSEMQIYRLNRVTDANYLKFLRLVGITPHLAKPAIVDVICNLPRDSLETIEIPQGTCLATKTISSGESLVFETNEDVHLLPLELKSVITYAASEWRDKTELNAQSGVFFFAFGKDAEEQNQLLFGFQSPVEFPEHELKINVTVYDLDLPATGNFEDISDPEIVPSARLEWEFWNGQIWQKLAGVRDQTVALTRTGNIFLPAIMGIVAAPIEDIVGDGSLQIEDSLYWIRVGIAEAGYELPPRIDKVMINTVSASHAQSRGPQYFESSVLPFQTIKLDHPPVLAGSTCVKVLETDSVWREWMEVDDLQASGPGDSHYITDLVKGTLKFGDGINGRIPPQNTVNIRVARYEYFASSGKRDQIFSFSAPPLSNLILEVKEKSGDWISWTPVSDFKNSGPQDRHVVIDLQRGEIKFGDGCRARIPIKRQKGKKNVRFGWYETFSGTGEPDQYLTLKQEGLKASDIAVSVFDEVTEWVPWGRVDNFNDSGPSDLNYTYDESTGTVRFGDCSHGFIPPKSRFHIKVKYKSGGGVIGNIPADSIDMFSDSKFNEVDVKNDKPASGGKETEIMADAKERARRDLKKIYKAVTSKDHWELALSTPGLRVSRVKVLPMFDPDFPQLKMPGTVTVVVLPFILPDTTDRARGPSMGFKQTVMNHLHSRRLLTSNLIVIGPDFIKVNVRVEIGIDPRSDKKRVGEEAKKVIRDFIDPHRGGPDGQGWPFGKDVYKSEIYQALESINGLTCVKSLVLVNNNIDTSGEFISIPPAGLAYAGDVSVAVK
jgi:hypothetical protein